MVEVRPKLQNFSRLLIPCRKSLLSACQKGAPQAASCSFARMTCVHQGHLCEDCPTHTFICRICRASGYAGPGFLHLLILPDTSQHQQDRSFPSFAKLLHSLCFHLPPHIVLKIRRRIQVQFSLMDLSQNHRGQRGPLEVA